MHHVWRFWRIGGRIFQPAARACQRNEALKSALQPGPLASGRKGNCAIVGPAFSTRPSLLH